MNLPGEMRSRGEGKMFQREVFKRILKNKLLDSFVNTS